MQHADATIPAPLLTALENFTGDGVDAAIILGSGLGDFADRLERERSISTQELPGYPRSTVPGHAGMLHLCRSGDERLLLFQGRIHGYEGYAPEETVLPVRIAAALGAQRLLVTNAAGGLHPSFSAGDLMLITDALALPVSPLLPLERLFPASDTLRHTSLVSPSLAWSARAAAEASGVALREGVYAYCTGPSYETPAEIAFYRMAGADAVGMSTVPELYAARDAGMEVLGISCITNKSVTVRRRVTHDEVTAVAARVAEQFSRLVLSILSRW